MSFFESWFGGKEKEWIQPEIRFGRYSDSYKKTESYDAWDKALDVFEEGKFLDSLELFFAFLRDDTEDNVCWEKTGQSISFEIFQGSKRLIGWANPERIRIEGRVARIIETSPELLRRLVEQNYSLKFSRYALDPNQHITVVFDTIAAEASPFKLYYAFKEVAIQADKQDDLLLEEFGQMEAVDNSHLQALPAGEKKIKHHFILDKIRAILEEVKDKRLAEYPSGVAYLLLDLVYKIDYLIKPEGHTMECLERMHRQFFSTEKAYSPRQKNEILIEELKRLLARREQAFSREMYQIKTTFGITSSITHDRLIDLIDGELHDMDWYIENDFPKIAAAIPSYMIGYSLFNFALPQPDRDFFHLFYRVSEAIYFKDLGFKPDYCDCASQAPNRKIIKQAINQIVKKHRSRYPNLRPAVSKLSFDNMILFSKSYLLMVRDLDLTRID